MNRGTFSQHRGIFSFETVFVIDLTTEKLMIALTETNMTLEDDDHADDNDDNVVNDDNVDNVDNDDDDDEVSGCL